MVNMTERCASLKDLNDFNLYIDQLKSATSFNITELDRCKEEICGAIWGDANPDISGIGVSIGYAVELALGFVLASLIIMIRQRYGPRAEFFQVVLKAGFDAFFEFAIYFAIAIELAAIVMLVNKDFGISTAGFGANEAQIALAVSVVCILPLLYPVALLPLELFHPESDRQARQNRKMRQDQRRRDFSLMLFALVCVLFFYPFLSQCIHNWAPLRVGEGKGGNGKTYVTDEEWERIRNMCFGEVTKFTISEHWALAVCEMMASLLIFLFMLWHAMELGVRRLQTQDRYIGEERQRTVTLSRTQRFVERAWASQSLVQALLLFVPLFLGCVLLWCVFRLRSIQAAAASNMGSEYAGDDWGFGQIVGIIIFAPVPAEMLFAAWEARSLILRSDYDSVSSRS
ncbi:hypothetical protein CTAM01_09313 [Colletotrichum tamarilloi]|uniref:Uncharacterized protein n=1 Tax=Colletotrichum tamarilloi TaxID=1209934 RepID=A0ABQ9R3Q2_9PEZI|nr:uncharacterized protein CTAM01_09313 [Colletotrichum tamarilloi]KAK1493852.1 hypothetical protein CTAM01_09313 [Colletotrichum tamarilloi]